MLSRLAVGVRVDGDDETQRKEHERERRPGGDTPQGASLRALRVQIEIEENISDSEREGGLGERKREIDRRARGRSVQRHARRDDQRK